MFEVYIKHRSRKRAYGSGIVFDSYDSAVNHAHRLLDSWWGKAGVYEWLKIKDVEKRKYIATYKN